MIFRRAFCNGCPFLLDQNTASFIGSSTYAIRRSRVKGRMTRPYWDCLRSPRSRSAMDQMKDAISEWFSVFIGAPCKGAMVERDQRDTGLRLRQ